MVKFSKKLYCKLLCISVFYFCIVNMFCTFLIKVVKNYPMRFCLIFRCDTSISRLDDVGNEERGLAS